MLRWEWVAEASCIASEGTSPKTFFDDVGGMARFLRIRFSYITALLNEFSKSGALLASLSGNIANVVSSSECHLEGDQDVVQFWVSLVGWLLENADKQCSPWLDVMTAFIDDLLQSLGYAALNPIADTNEAGGESGDQGLASGADLPCGDAPVAAAAGSDPGSLVQTPALAVGGADGDDADARKPMKVFPATLMTRWLSPCVPSASDVAGGEPVAAAPAKPAQTRPPALVKKAWAVDQRNHV